MNSKSKNIIKMKIVSALNIGAYLVVTLFCNISFALNAKHLKNCTLLPVTDNVNGALSFKVFDAIDKELKASNWCSYRSNSGILAVFSSYRDKVPDYIDKPEVLKIVADKLDVGSIMRIALENRIGGIAVRLIIYVNSGEDVYFDEQAFIQDENIDGVIQQVKNWMQDYNKTLPYDGIVSGVLGEQITMDVARTTGIKVNQEFIVKRLVKPKKHPLLNKIVEWETQTIAKGKIFNVSDGQVIGVAKIYFIEGQIQPGDWVSVQTQQYSLDDSITEDELKKNEFGKLGMATLLLSTGNYVAASQTTQSNKFEGLLSGVSLSTDLWITRQYFSRIVVERTFGNLSKSSANSDADNLTITPSVFKLAAGYKILPLGYFYGPQIDVYAGYANYLYDTQYNLIDGMDTHAFSGVMLGTKVDMPVTKMVRGFVRAEIIILADFKEDKELYGNEKSNSNLSFAIGGNYEWSPILGIEALLEVVSNKAKFDKINAKEIEYQSTQIKAGLTYQF